MFKHQTDTLFSSCASQMVETPQGRRCKKEQSASQSAPNLTKDCYRARDEERAARQIQICRVSLLNHATHISERHYYRAHADLLSQQSEHPPAQRVIKNSLCALLFKFTYCPQGVMFVNNWCVNDTLRDLLTNHSVLQLIINVYLINKKKKRKIHCLYDQNI